MDNSDAHQNWLKQMNIGKTVEVRLTNIESQVDLHTSLLESERGTRTRATKDLHQRFDEQDKRLIRLERLAWGFIGAVAIIKFLPSFIDLIKTH